MFYRIAIQVIPTRFFSFKNSDFFILIFEGKDVIMVAPSGKGKTTSAAIASLQKVNSEVLERQVLMLVGDSEKAIKVFYCKFKENKLTIFYSHKNCTKIL